MLKSFFVAINGSAPAAAALEYTCYLASLSGGKVHIGHIIELNYEPAIATGMVAGTIEYVAAAPPMQALDELAQYQKERQEQAEHFFGAARHICRRWGVACDTFCITGLLEEEILSQARAVDLAALGQSSHTTDARKIGHMTEAIVRSSPQPVLIATAPFQHPTELLILYNGGERSLHALCIGAQIARQAGLPIGLITVTPTREEGEMVGRRGSHYLTDHEVQFTSSIIASQEAPDRELVMRMNALPTALVLMGAFGESRIKEWLTGSTTRTILRETRNPLILFRH